jgi:hypothetical protein
MELIFSKKERKYNINFFKKKKKKTKKLLIFF